MQRPRDDHVLNDRAFAHKWFLKRDDIGRYLNMRERRVSFYKITRDPVAAIFDGCMDSRRLNDEHHRSSTAMRHCVHVATSLRFAPTFIYIYIYIYVCVCVRAHAYVYV